jgi:hypothetical protein
MSRRKPMKRLLALRLLEEEREEAELRRQRQLRQACLEALLASEARKTLASRTLHAALEIGDRTGAISAEMALACGPMERRLLRQRLAQHDALVEAAEAAWRDTRVHRMQMDSLVTAAEMSQRKDLVLREQKSLDGWFLTSRPPLRPTETDESSQREWPIPPVHSGRERAGGGAE